MNVAPYPFDVKPIPRGFRHVPTSDTIVAFARENVPAQTIASALVVPLGQVLAVIEGAVAAGLLSRMPTVLRADLDIVLAENERLRLRVSQLVDQLCDKPVIPYALLGLTASEAKLFACLMSRETATREALYLALYPSRAAPPPNPKIIDVFVLHLRRKLLRHGLTVETIWGRGYAMSETMKVKARALVSAEAGRDV